MTTPTASAPKGSSKLRPPEGAPARSRAREVEGYRGIAALSTLIFHVWQQYYRYDADGSHPPIGNKYAASLISMEVVDLFLVLSAYLLTLAYARAAINGGSVRPAGTFLFRRAIRILPLYFLAICVVWSTRNPSLPGDWRDLVEHLTFTHIFDGDRIFYTVGPTWSLSLEIMFYFVLIALGPLAVRACRRLPERRSRVTLCTAGCAVLFAIPLVWVGVAHYALGIPHTNWAVYFGPQARFCGFAAGMFLAVLVTALGDRGRLSARWSTGLALGVLVGAYLLSLISEPENFLFTYYHQFSAVLWFVLLYCTIHIRGRIGWHRALRARWLTGVGLISYSLYIWHEPIMLELDKAGLLPSSQAGFPLGVAIVMLVAMPAAWLSYWVIEYPASLLGKLKDRGGKPRDFYPEPPRTAEAARTPEPAAR